MNERPSRSRPSWSGKFTTAIRGCWLGVREHNSFWVHLPAAAAVVVAAIYLRVTVLETALLLLCITLVLTTELLNTAVESLAKAVTQSEHPHVGQSLDIASGAVLVAAVGSAVVGLAIFVPRLLQL